MRKNFVNARSRDEEFDRLSRLIIQHIQMDGGRIILCTCDLCTQAGKQLEQRHAERG